jgi:hypothetical protein
MFERSVTIQGPGFELSHHSWHRVGQQSNQTSQNEVFLFVRDLLGGAGVEHGEVNQGVGSDEEVGQQSRNLHDK